MSRQATQQQPEPLDYEELQAYQQLSDDLRAFEVVMMHHFFKKDAKEKTLFANDVRASLEDAYEKNCPRDPEDPLKLDCGPYCAKGRSCVPC